MYQKQCEFLPRQIPVILGNHPGDARKVQIHCYWQGCMRGGVSRSPGKSFRPASHSKGVRSLFDESRPEVSRRGRTVGFLPKTADTFSSSCLQVFFDSVT